ncbi:MAG: chain length determinant protein EpsF [Aquabacterium sp.]|uniref:chain length determinant protein EpsF n=1 Tax=Aquabacterium sp. TaxID=1872578 RepID=UPI0025BE3EF5|nr:chain length determinant protein EpsF [Aquabacterium sp.]MBI5926403.1 chain length determinant protein EpsF [Aquabacterium sp.]
MSINQFLSILKARWGLLATVLLLTIVTTVALSLYMPKKYTAVATMVIDVKSPDPVAGMVLQGMLAPGYMATQMDILKSDRVALKAIRTLKLDQNPQLHEQWREEAQGRGEFDDWIVDVVQKPLDVMPGKESSVINISYTATQPAFAAALANAFMQAYIDTTLELRVEPAKRYTTMFDAQAKVFRERLEQARARLSQYQQENGLVMADERLDVETNRLNELSNQLVMLQAVSADSNSRQAAAVVNGDRLQEVINNPVIANLKADLSRQEARLKEISNKMGEAHPQVTELRANINELRLRIDGETKRIAASVGINNAINQSRESQLKAALAQQRQRLLEIKQQRDQAALYLQDVENAQRAYDAIQTRLSQATIESQANQTNVSILKAASAPADPSSPKVFLNIALSVLLGGMLAVGCALAVELSDRRIRTGSDIALGMDTILLGELQPTDAKIGRATAMITRLTGPKTPLLERPTS